ncbi:MAG: hypothetical protein JXO22_07355, partial [Phycisphaerae bacterium]|nr:hypothetical protein [Phycisphaerae bacterium]
RVRAMHADGMVGAWATSQANFSVGLPGDLNCDGVADIFDIDAFVLAITSPADYDAEYPACSRALADCNGDGAADVFDIGAFVDIVTGI